MPQRPEASEEPTPAPVSQEFDAFYMREYARVFGLALALSGSRWAAEDLTQEAFLAAHSQWHSIGRYEQPGVWVRRVVANKAVSAFRRRVSEAKALARWRSRDRTEVPDVSLSDPTFWSAIRSLPQRQAQVIALHYVEDLTVEEVADILDVSPGTVKQHLNRGRAALSRTLSDEDGGP